MTGKILTANRPKKVWGQGIEITVTYRNSSTKENNPILFWHNWVANQLTFIPFLMNVHKRPKSGRPAFGVFEKHPVAKQSGY